MGSDKISRGLSIVAFFALISLCFAFSSVMYFSKHRGRLTVFRFESVDEGHAVEYRILPRKSGDEAISLFVDELLLGPRTERSRPIFSPGTRSTFCFLRGKTLYVNLTDDILSQSGNAGKIMDGIELFKKNITTTFPGIKNIEIFIDGKNLISQN